jgi:hypothetical protein
MEDIKQLLAKIDEKQDKQSEQLAALGEAMKYQKETNENNSDLIKETADSIGKINTELVIHSKILEKQEKNIEIHIKRTDLLEEKLSLLDKDVSFYDKLLKSVGWVLGLVATVVAIIQGLK